MARFCLYRPDAVADFSPALALARLAATSAADEARAVLGGALLRTGLDGEAIRALGEDATAEGRAGRTLAAARRGQKAEASALVKRLREEMRGGQHLGCYQAGLEALLAEVETRLNKIDE